MEFHLQRVEVYMVNAFYLIGVLDGFAREIAITFAENFTRT